MTPLVQSWASGPYNRPTWLPSLPPILWRRLLSGVPLGPLLPALPPLAYGEDALWVDC